MIGIVRSRWVVIVLAVGTLLASNTATGLASGTEGNRNIGARGTRSAPSWSALQRVLLPGTHHDSAHGESEAPQSPAQQSPAQPRAARPPTLGPYTDSSVYFIHGYAADGAVDCGEYWDGATRKFTERGWRSALHTVGFYAGDTNCDTVIGNDKQVSTDTRITKIAANFANYVYANETKRGEPVDIVAHSMGGIVARVAMLGTARNWPGFPAGELRIGNVVTLSTPHGGLHCDLEPGCEAGQLRQQSPGSGLIDVLHAPANQLDRAWSRDTNWYFIGSDEDDVVPGDSGTYEGFAADGKYRYLPGGSAPVTHGAVHSIDHGTFRMRRWRPGKPARVAQRAPSPLDVAYGGVAGSTARPDGWAAFVALRNPVTDGSELS